MTSTSTLSFVLPLAENTTSPLAWAVVGFCIILGAMVALGPSKRTTEFKRDDE